MLREMQFPKTATTIAVVVSALFSGAWQVLAGVSWQWLIVVQFLNAVMNWVSVRYSATWANKLIVVTRFDGSPRLERLIELLCICLVNAPLFALIREVEKKPYASLYFAFACLFLWMYREFVTPQMDKAFRWLKYYRLRSVRRTRREANRVREFWLTLLALFT